jgi:large subunit ribosomal protein L18e
MERTISKTRIEGRSSKKTNKNLAEAITTIKKKNPEFAKHLAMSVKKWAEMNLDQIDRNVKEGEAVFIPGKVLSSGELTKKIKIVAWKASEKAQEKMKSSKVDFVEIIEEIKKNPELKNLRLIR